MPGLPRANQFEAKTFARKAVQKIGLDVKPYNCYTQDGLRLVSFLRSFEIDTVLDVGANSGQFASELIKCNFDGRIISFEALPEAHAALTRKASKFGERWIVAPQVALCDRAGTASFHVTLSNTSSSLLRPTEEFSKMTPEVAVSTTIEVETARLDDLLESLDIRSSRTFIKIDVQGGEAMVLAGCPILFSDAKGIMVELSFAPLYHGQSNERNLVESICAAGFNLWDIQPGYRDPSNFRLKQADAIFFRH